MLHEFDTLFMLSMFVAQQKKEDSSYVNQARQTWYLILS